MPEATEVVPEEAEAPKPSAPGTTEPPAEPFKAVRGTRARHSLAADVSPTLGKGCLDRTSFMSFQIAIFEGTETAKQTKRI